jgi:hypothetical protein
MSTPINVDLSIDPINLAQTATNTLAAYPTIKKSSYTLLDEFKLLPNIFKTNIAPIAFKFSTIICRIDNLKLNIDDLSTHLTANTAPDYIIKQFKNILKNENELLAKQAVIRIKVNSLYTLKITQANDLISQFNHRFDISTPLIEKMIQKMNISDIPTERTFWEPYLDHLISLKLVEFQCKQDRDHEIKAKKLILFNEKKAKDSIPVVITQKVFNNLNNRSKNLVNKPKGRPRSNTTNKQATNRTTTPKSDPSNPRKVFQPRKQKKSPTVPPNRKNAGKKN